MKTEKDIEKLAECARKRVSQIFKEHGLSSYRKIGLQKAIRTALVEVAVKGTIDIKRDVKNGKN